MAIHSRNTTHAQHANVVYALKKLVPKLRPSEQKVANFVIENPSKVTSMRIVDLSAQTEVSEPTVVRFCRSIGYKSFQQFKINLAQNLAVSPTFGSFNITDSDSIVSASHKVFDATINALLSMRNALSIPNIEKAVHILRTTEHLEIFGYGTSAAIARDAQHKFFRLIHSTIAYDDPHIQCMSAANMPEKSAIIAISQSGRSRNLLQAIRIARQNQVDVIAVCPSNTEMARLACVHLQVDILDDFNMFTTMTTRTVHLTIIDVLVISVAMRMGRLDLVLRRVIESQRALYEPES